MSLLLLLRSSVFDQSSRGSFRCYPERDSCRCSEDRAFEGKQHAKTNIVKKLTRGDPKLKEAGSHTDLDECLEKRTDERSLVGWFPRIFHTEIEAQAQEEGPQNSERALSGNRIGEQTRKSFPAGKRT